MTAGILTGEPATAAAAPLPVHPSGIDRVLLGHNALFGVDHLSQVRGAAKGRRFERAEAVAGLLADCHRLGVRAMMMSTHPRAPAVLAALDGLPAPAASWRLYPLVPNIQKYVRGANEKGLVDLLLEIAGGAGLARTLAWSFQAGRSVVGGDVEAGLRLLLDVELAPFRGRRLGAVFLHDALTDLALGLGVERVLEVFRRHVEERWGAPAGFATKNLPLLVERTRALGWERLLAMASFNARGFWVNPSLDRFAGALGDPRLTLLAMNTLASGALDPETAYRFLGAHPVASVVVGVSSRGHAEETVAAIRRHLFAGSDAGDAG